MNTQELMAVATLLKACETFNGFACNALIAAKGGVPLLLPKSLEEDLHKANLCMRISVASLEPGLSNAIASVGR